MWLIELGFRNYFILKRYRFLISLTGPLKSLNLDNNNNNPLIIQLVLISKMLIYANKGYC